MDLQKKNRRKNTPANLEHVPGWQIHHESRCILLVVFLRVKSIAILGLLIQVHNTILVVGEMNGLSFRKENDHPATVHFHNFSEKGNVVQS